MDAGQLTNAALVISECQRGVVDPELAVLPGLAEQAVSRGIVERIATLADAFRLAGRPVVHCLIAHRRDLAGLRRNSLLTAMILKNPSMLEGTPDVEVPPAIAPKPGDIVSRRAVGLTAFYGTELDAMLRLLDVETIVLAGVSTIVALPGLAVEAVNRGYHVLLPEDCTAGASQEMHEFMVGNVLRMYARITTADDVLRRLAADAPVAV